MTPAFRNESKPSTGCCCDCSSSSIYRTSSIHRDAEEKLASKHSNPGAKIGRVGGEIDLIGHSAGCGVILGALYDYRRCSREPARFCLPRWFRRRTRWRLFWNM